VPATVVFRGDLASRAFIAFALTSERVPVDDRRLADPGVALEALAPTRAGSGA
jgi:hypothetical protein